MMGPQGPDNFGMSKQPLPETMRELLEQCITTTHNMLAHAQALLKLSCAESFKAFFGAT